jgi:NADPH:quinone reductase-like Zn-dependent oxidoreductase
VFIDTGEIAGNFPDASKSGFHKVLELIGTSTLLASLKCARRNGNVCMIGMVGSEWILKEFAPMEAIPNTVCLTSYRTDADSFNVTPIDELAAQYS